MFEEIPYKATITCDICGRKDCGSPDYFFKDGWAILGKFRTGWDGDKQDPSEIAVCRGCLYIRRFWDKVNEDLYTCKRDVMNSWAKLDHEDRV
jgi:hypothetical protein